MAKGKKSFILYADLLPAVKKMPNDKAGELFKLILSYVNDENPTTDDLLVDVMFENIKQQLKRDLKKYEVAKENKANGGRLGNLKRWNLDLYEGVINNKITLEEAEKIATSRKVSHTDKEVSHTDSNLSHTIASVAVNDSVSVSDSVIDNDINKEIVSEQSSDDIPLLNLDTTNQTLEIKITKSFFDLFRKIQEENGVTVFTKYDKTKLKTWLIHVKRMIELDKVTLEDLREVHAWLSDPKFRNSEFWRKNIISTQKLREQFPKLQSAMKDDLKTLSKNKPQRSKSRLGL